MKKLVISCIAVLAFSAGFAQTIEELKAEQAVKKDSIKAIQVESMPFKVKLMPSPPVGKPERSVPLVPIYLNLITGIPKVYPTTHQVI